MDTQPISWPEDDLGRPRFGDHVPAAGEVQGYSPNAGGVICASVEHRGGNRTQAFAEIDERIRATITELFERTRAGDVSPRRAGLDMAATRLASAQAYRRRF